MQLHPWESCIGVSVAMQSVLVAVKNYITVHGDKDCHDSVFPELLPLNSS